MMVPCSCRSVEHFKIVCFIVLAAFDAEICKAIQISRL